MIDDEKLLIKEINIQPIGDIKQAICFSIDDAYAKYFSVALQSFITVSDKNKNYDIVVLFNNLSSQNIFKLASQLTSNISLRFYNVEKIKNKFIDKNIFKPQKYWSESIYFRLLIPEIFKNYEKILYCDSDIIFNSNIDDIFSIDTNHKCLLAVIDSISPELNYDIKRKNFIKNYLEIKNLYGYFNSGVILFNLEKINNEKYFNNLVLNLNKYKELLYPDQDILNTLFQDSVKYISHKWNFQTHIYIYKQKNLSNYNSSFEDDYIVAKESPAIIHYTGNEKPWHNPALFLYDKFWYFARRTPFYEEIIYENQNENLKLLACKDEINWKYICTKILSNITFGSTRELLINRRYKLKQKIRKIRSFSRMAKDKKCKNTT